MNRLPITSSSDRNTPGTSKVGRARRLPDDRLEAGLPGPVCGVDEAGRGPWAGPVVAAAIILDMNDLPAGLDDSKRLSPGRRETLFEALTSTATIGVGMSSVDEIERLNILRASLLAMRRAIAELGTPPAIALIDGPHVPSDLPCPARPVIGGDGRALSIAAASIVAKVTRDRMMVALSQQFPAFGWETNMGYGTKAHEAALARYGVTQHHRRTFRPIHKMLCQTDNVSA